MLVIGAVLQGLGFIIWFFSHTFVMFALGFLFWAIAGALESGTEEGLIYDNLKYDGREDNFTEIYGKAHFYANIGTIVGILSAGFIAIFIQIEVIALISAVICFLNVVFALQIREKNFYSEKLEEEEVGFFETFNKAGSFIKGSKVALISILFLVLFASLGGYLDEFDVLIINDWELSEIWISAILSIRFIFIALGDILAPVIEKKINSIKQIFLLNMVGCLFLLIFVIIWHQFAILIFGLAFMMIAITDILLTAVVQKEIKEEGRATVMSFVSIGQNIGMIGLSLVFALLAGIFTLQQVYIIVAVYGIVGGILFAAVFKGLKFKKKRIVNDV